VGSNLYDRTSLSKIRATSRQVLCGATVYRSKIIRGSDTPLSKRANKLIYSVRDPNHRNKERSFSARLVPPVLVGWHKVLSHTRSTTCVRPSVCPKYALMIWGASALGDFLGLDLRALAGDAVLKLFTGYLNTFKPYVRRDTSPRNLAFPSDSGDLVEQTLGPYAICV
jgi:hypothetical protein